MTWQSMLWSSCHLSKATYCIVAQQIDRFPNKQVSRKLRVPPTSVDRMKAARYTRGFCEDVEDSDNHSQVARTL